MSREPLEEYKYKEKLSLRDLKSKEVEVHKIECPTCSNPVSADNLNIQTNVAKCNSCNGIFSFSNHVEKLSLQHKISQEILQPEGVELTSFQDELDISVEQPWSGLEVIIVSFLPLMILLAIGGIAANLPPTQFFRIGLIAFLVISLIAYLSYFVIRKRHKIHVHIDDHDLYIERRPRKLIKDKRYAREDIDQVYIKKVMTANGSGGVGVFMIYNGIEGQKHIELIKSVSTRSKAKYIEQEIERQLGIPDRRVPEEAD